MRHREKPASFCPRDCPCGPCFLLLIPPGEFKEELCVEGIFIFFSSFPCCRKGKWIGDFSCTVQPSPSPSPGLCGAVSVTGASALGAAGAGGGRWGPGRGTGTDTSPAAELSSGGGMRRSPRLRIARPDTAFRLYFPLFRVIVQSGLLILTRSGQPIILIMSRPIGN